MQLISTLRLIAVRRDLSLPKARMFSKEAVQRLVEAGIAGARVAVTDLTGTSDHFGIRVVAESFAGKSRIERHKMVHKALGQYLTREIHAVEIKALTPAEAAAAT
ncbi:MAG: BolA/IbaG family iron-sulfur metabolism protein [Planctomycetota bacterium]